MNTPTPLYPDLQIDQWLQDGSRHTPTLPALARWIVAATTGLVGSILDVGCGSGEFLRLLIQKGIARDRLFGCDIEPDHAELARRRTSLATIRQHDLLNGNPYPDVTFNIVTTINWLQSDWGAEYAVKIPRTEPTPHRWERIIEVVASCLQPGGIWIWDFHSQPSGPFEEVLSRYPHIFQRWGVLHFNPEGQWRERYPFFVYYRLPTA